MVTQAQLSELTPTTHGQERMFRRCRDRVAQGRPQTPDGLYATRLDRKDPTSSQAKFVVARNRGFQLDMPGYDFVFGYQPPRLGVHYSCFTNDAFGEAVFAEAEHLLVDALRKLLRITP